MQLRNQCACTLSLYLLLCDAGCHGIALFFLDMRMHDQAKVQIIVLRMQSLRLWCA